MTPAYVRQTIARHTDAPVTFFYHADPLAPGAVFATAFVPAMTSRGCTRVYARAMPADMGGVFYGYACHGG
jgi:hypothetical protein